MIYLANSHLYCLMIKTEEQEDSIKYLKQNANEYRK